MENSATTAVEQEQTTEASSPTPTRSWEEVASGLWAKRRIAPKYPKNLTELEILAQTSKVFSDLTPEKVVGLDAAGQPTEERDVPRGTSLLMRLTQLDSDKVDRVLMQFDDFVHQISRSCGGRTPWPSWKHAWRDFAEYVGLNTTAHKTAMMKEGFPA